MDYAVRRLIENIHRSGRKCVLAVTGGGAEAAGLLLSVPGASRTVLEVLVPYDATALAEFLGVQPEQSCSSATSRAMAARAHSRAQWLVPGEPVVGLGCTASLATDRPKLGDHRFHLSVHTDEQNVTYSLTLTKGARDREAEEAVLDAALLNALATAVGISERVPFRLLEEEALHEDTSNEPYALASFLQGRLNALCACPDGQLTTATPLPTVVLPGSFNPVHKGHWRLAEIASQRLGAPVAFELSVQNVDKPPLAAAEIRRRLEQFAWRAPVWITRASTFVEKASLFPGAVYLVGADTAERILAPKYYQDSEARLLEALEHIREQGSSFLVAGRDDAQGRFLSLDDLRIPESYRSLFHSLPQSDFHIPISSTALRQQLRPSAGVALPTEAQ
jgi:nicotinamide mononucleotide (NMN) deamidase PncC